MIKLTQQERGGIPGSNGPSLNLQHTSGGVNMQQQIPSSTKSRKTYQVQNNYGNSGQNQYSQREENSFLNKLSNQ
jgi:hypothetical protein|tara:strand:+ start:109 stop:333 length:225 start_codon:yes stop_codon:yes gene_type:complete